MNREKLGQAIQQKRVARLLCSAECAALCDIDLETLDSIENGGSDYTTGQLAIVCEYLGIEYGKVLPVGNNPTTSL